MELPYPNVLTKELPFPANVNLTINYTHHNLVNEHYDGRETRIGQYLDLSANYVLSCNALSRIELKNILDFFDKVKGNFEGFLFKDPLDHKVTSIPTDTGHGILTQGVMLSDRATGTLHLCKSYLVRGGYNRYWCYTRPITRSLSSFTGWSDANNSYSFQIENSTGKIINAGAYAHTVDGEFYIPVRFADKEINWQVISDDPCGAYALISSLSVQTLKEHHAPSIIPYIVESPTASFLPNYR